MWLLATNLWIMLVPSVEQITATGATVGEERHDVTIPVLRIGDDYLVALVALGELFDLEVRTEEDGKRLFVRGGPNIYVEMRLYDPVVTVNGKERLLEVPPMDAGTPMVPLKFFSKLARKDVTLEMPPPKKWARLRHVVTSILMRKLVILNIIMGALCTGLWVSMALIMRDTEKGLSQSYLRRSVPYVFLALIMLFHVLHAFLTKIEGLFGPS